MKRTWAATLSLTVGILLGGLVWLVSSLQHQQLKPSPIPPAPDFPLAPIIGLGDPYGGGWLLNFWLQSQDSQAVGELKLSALDYTRVIQWLNQIDYGLPQARYPILSAVFVYGTILNPTKTRQMYLEARKLFLHSPKTRWYDYAMATIQAKHKLKDPQLALSMAEDLLYLAPPEAPDWAHFMKLYLLRSANETGLAIQLAREALKKGIIKNQNEVKLLKQFIEQLEQKQQSHDSTTRH